MSKLTKKLGVVFAASALLMTVPASTVSAKPMTASEASNIEKTVRSTMATSDRVQELEDAAIYYYWNGGQLKQNEKKIFQGVTLKSNFGIMEHLFKEAITIDPSNENLQMDLASTYRMQNQNNRAMKIYRDILANNPNNFTARVKLAGLEKVENQDSAYKEDLDKLAKADPVKAEKFAKLFEDVNHIGDLKINTTIPSNLKDDGANYIVILGYALDKDGKMQPTMLKRLELCLKAAKKYPHSKIITTGGVPKKGKTEAGTMKSWLIKHGVKKDRIIEENLSTNTVENALFSMRDLVNANASSMILVTSASHMRRAYFLFNQAKKVVEATNTSEYQPNVKIEQVADVDNPSLLTKVNPAEYGATLDDSLRINGIWQLPGLQR